MSSIGVREFKLVYLRKRKIGKMPLLCIREINELEK
jgi:hypothetical protein